MSICNVICNDEYLVRESKDVVVFVIPERTAKVNACRYCVNCEDLKGINGHVAYICKRDIKKYDGFVDKRDYSSIQLNGSYGGAL